MPHRPLLRAGLAALSLAAQAAATPAAAGVPFFGKGKDKPAAEADKAAAKPAAEDKAAVEAVKAALRPSSALERKAADRADPLARAAFWTREVAVAPEDAEAGVRLAAALRTLGRYDEAANAAEQVLLRKPDAVEAHLEAARARVAQGQGFYAIAHLQAAQKLQPRDWRAPSMLAVAYEQTKRPEEADAAWRTALSLSPENPAIIANQALAVAARGQPEQAEAMLRRAAARPDATAAIRQNLALLLGLKGEIAEAEKLARQDLPPEQVDANLAYWRAASAKPGAAAAAGATAPAGRTWRSLQDAGR